jgi:hypothetical protein
MSTYKYKILAFIIALKRSRRNSIILKGPVYKIATKYGICASSFKKYLQEAIDLGYIVEKEDRYVVIKFKEIVRHFCKEHDIYFGHYKILRNKSSQTNVKNICEELLRIAIMDNVINPQEYMIAKKNKDIELVRYSLKTDKKPSYLPKRDYSRLKKLSNSGTLSAQGLRSLYSSKTDIVVSSNRHASKRIGISNFKAGQVLSKGDRYFSRSKLDTYYPGCNQFNLEALRNQHPRAWVVPLPNYNKIRVSYGSQLHNLLPTLTK